MPDPNPPDNASPRLRAALDELAAVLAEEDDDVAGFGLERSSTLGIGLQAAHVPGQRRDQGLYVCLGYDIDSGCTVELFV